MSAQAVPEISTGKLYLKLSKANGGHELDHPDRTKPACSVPMYGRHALMGSGGKDSALALDRARRAGIEVARLISFYDSATRRVRFHSTRVEMLEAGGGDRDWPPRDPDQLARDGAEPQTGAIVPSCGGVQRRRLRRHPPRRREGLVRGARHRGRASARGAHGVSGRTCCSRSSFRRAGEP